MGDHKCLSTTDIAPYSHTDNLELRLRSQEPRYQTAGEVVKELERIGRFAGAPVG